MDYIYLWSIAALSGLILIGLIHRRDIHPSRDFFFVLLWVEFLIYLHIAPNVWVPNVEPEFRPYYFWMELGSLLLFEVPFAWLYLRFFKRWETRRPASTASLEVDRKRLMLLALCSALFALAFLAIALKEDIFLTRAGAVNTTDLQLNLPATSFFIFRYFQFTAPFLIAVLLACLLIAHQSFASQRFSRDLMWGAFILVAGIFFANQASNSRLHAIIAVTVLMGVVLRFARVHLFSQRGVALGLVSLVLAFYAYQVALNFRRIYSEQGLTAEIFQPFVWNEAKSESELLGFRLNGIDLMARIAPLAERQGYSMGRAWEGAVVGTFAVFLDQSVVERYKRTYMVSPKHYLMLEYTSLGTADYPSSMLTDSFGNFGAFGFLLVAVILAWSCAFVSEGLVNQRSPAVVLVALFIASPLMSFELELAGYVSTLVKAAPIVIFLLYFANPFQNSTAAPVRPAYLRPEPTTGSRNVSDYRR